MGNDKGLCFFSQYALAHSATPTFSLNSLYNFFVWEELLPNFGAYKSENLPKDWLSCAPGNGHITPETYATCNATQKVRCFALGLRPWSLSLSGLCSCFRPSSKRFASQ